MRSFVVGICVVSLWGCDDLPRAGQTGAATGDAAVATLASDGVVADPARRAAAPVGIPCASDGECGDGTFCNIGYTWGATTCVPLLEEGFCETDDHCRSGRCAGVCIEVQRCADPATAPASTLGWSCLDDSDCCDAGSRCVGSWAAPRTCRRP